MELHVHYANNQFRCDKWSDMAIVHVKLAKRKSHTHVVVHIIIVFVMLCIKQYHSPL